MESLPAEARSETREAEAKLTPSPRLSVTIITGMSGAGKSLAMQTFEDEGYFTIDNLPPQMLLRVAELFSLEGSRVDKLALVFDARGGAYFEHLDRSLAELEKSGVHARILFLEASDEALIARYQETRRPHPLSPSDHPEDLLQGIRKDRALMAAVRERADVVLDTGGLNVHQLRACIRETLLAGELRGQLLMTSMSFGYKFGLPREADMVFDARFLPNPHWVDSLRPLTGLDVPVRDYVLNRLETHGFLDRVCGLLRFLIPLYLAEHKRQLVVAIGCTGGRHRSVALAEALAASFAKEPGVVTTVRHRDLERSG